MKKENEQIFREKLKWAEEMDKQLNIWEKQGKSEKEIEILEIGRIAYRDVKYAKLRKLNKDFVKK